MPKLVGECAVINSECAEHFGRLHTKLESIDEIKEDLKSVVHSINGNGSLGIKDRLTTLEAEQRSNRRWLAAIGTAVGLIIAVLTLIAMMK